MNMHCPQLKQCLVNEVLFSITVTLAPKSWASMAVLSPQGPAPTTVTWTTIFCLVWKKPLLPFKSCLGRKQQNMKR